MGCWCSRHAQAKKSKLPPPTFGAGTKVLIKKHTFSADFEVKDLTTAKDENGEEKPVSWMLMDAVGGIFDSAYDYFLKYRALNQEESTVLGCANLKKEHDYMFFKVTYAHQHRGIRGCTYSKRSRRWEDRKVEGHWVIARRTRLYSDLEQTNLIGRLDVVGQGYFKRKLHTERWRQRTTDSDGNTRWSPRSSTRGWSECNLKQFVHKLHVYGHDFNISYDEKESGSWFKADTLTFVASHAQTGVPLFRVVSDGENTATVETCVNGDPVSSILAAFTVAIRLDPKEFHSVCKDYCKDNMSLWSRPGMVGGFGLTDTEYQAEYATEVIAPPPMGFGYGVPVAQPVQGQAQAAIDPMKEPLLMPQPDVEPFAPPPSGVEYAFAAVAVPTIVLPQISDEHRSYQEQVMACQSEGDGDDGDGDEDDDGEDGGEGDGDGDGDDEAEGGDDGDDEPDEEAEFFREAEEE